MDVSDNNTNFVAKKGLSMFLLPGSAILFSLLGVGLIIWIAGSGLKSVAGSIMNTYNPDDKPLSIQKESKDGRIRVRKAGYDERLKLYYADIERTLDGKYMNTVVGNSQKEMEDWLVRELERLCLKYDQTE